jgi:hypothetical protein
LLWRRFGDINQATAAAAAVGRAFAYVLIALALSGLFLGAPGLIWLGIIGFFLIVAGQAEENALKMKSVLGGLGLRRTMAVPAVTVPAELSIDDAVRGFFAPLGYRSFPVVEGGRAVGLLSIEQVEGLPALDRPTTSVGELTDRDPSLLFDERVTPDELTASGGFHRRGRAIILCRNGEIGILSATAIERALRAQKLLASTPVAEAELPGAAGTAS